MAVSITAEYCASLPSKGVRSAFAASIFRFLRQHGVWLTIIATIAVLPRLWVIANTPAPARDILRIVNAAKAFENEPFVVAVRSIRLHPVYPLTLVGVRRCLDEFTTLRGSAAWRRAGEIVNLVAYVSLLFAAYFAGSLLWNDRVAALGAIALACVPRQARYSCDVLSDGLHAAIWMAALALFIAHLQKPDRLRLFGAGCLAGVAFWTRPEALLLPMIILATLFTNAAFQWRLAKLRGLGREIIVFLLPAGLLIATYMALLGGVSPKNTVRALVGQSTIAEPGVAPTALLLLPDASKPHPPDVPVKTSWLGAVGNVICEFGQETRGLLAALAIVALLNPSRSMPLLSTRILMFFALTGFTGMLTILQQRAGFISGRYLLPILPFVAMLAIVGAEIVVGWVQRLPRLPWERMWSEATLTVRRTTLGRLALMAVFLVLVLPKWVRPLHEGCVAHVQAAAWLNENTLSDETVFDPSRFVGFLADRPYTQQLLDEAPLPRFAVIDAAIVHQVDAKTHATLTEVASKGTLAATFPHGAKTNIAVFIYSLPGRDAGRRAVEEKP